MSAKNANLETETEPVAIQDLEPGDRITYRDREGIAGSGTVISGSLDRVLLLKPDDTRTPRWAWEFIRNKDGIWQTDFITDVRRVVPTRPEPVGIWELKPGDRITYTDREGIRAGGTVMPGRYDGALLLKPDDTQAAQSKMQWLTLRSAGIWRSADFTDIRRMGIDRPEPLPGPRMAPDGRHFPWGPIDAIWDVGEEYQIVQFRRDTSGHVQPEVWESHGKTQFHPYIKGRDTGRSYDSLDEALVGVIAYKREGPNSQAARYFDRMTLKED